MNDKNTNDASHENPNQSSQCQAQGIAGTGATPQRLSSAARIHPDFPLAVRTASALVPDSLFPSFEFGFALDNAGTRMGQAAQDRSMGALRRAISGSCDALNRVQQVTGAEQ